MSEEIFEVERPSGKPPRVARITDKGIDILGAGRDGSRVVVHIRAADIHKMSELWLDEQRARSWKIVQSPEFTYAFPD